MVGGGTGRRGFSHFGAALGVSPRSPSTCGPLSVIAPMGSSHQLEAVPGVLDLITVCAGLPTAAVSGPAPSGVFSRRRGDRSIGEAGPAAGNPDRARRLRHRTRRFRDHRYAGRGGLRCSTGVPRASTLLLVGLYGAIAFFLVRTQLHNRRPLGGWWISGLGLVGIFTTCSAIAPSMPSTSSPAALTQGPTSRAHHRLDLPSSSPHAARACTPYSDAVYDWNSAPRRDRTSRFRSGDRSRYVPSPWTQVRCAFP